MNLNFIKTINKNNVFKFFPELEKLENVFENNICHNDESVYSHIMQVFGNCKHIMNKLDEKQQKFFDRIISENRIKDLFLVAVFFHDIGKFETIKVKNNTTICNNHEKIGARLLTQTRLNKLDKVEFKYIQMIVKNHSLLQLSLDNKKNFEKQYVKLKNKYKSIILELTILGIADIYNGDLEKNNKQEYEYRIRSLSNKIGVTLLK